MNCLVTGAGGIIGHYLIKDLLKSELFENIACVRKHSLRQYHKQKLAYTNERDWDLCFSNNVSALLDVVQPNVIFHLAGISSSSHSSHKDLWETNTVPLINILDNVPKSVNTKIILMSSTVIDNKPYNLYAASKKACEELLYSYRETYNNVSWLSFRPCAVVGACNRHGLLNDVIKKVQIEDSVNVYGKDPGSVKPYIYAGELSHFIIDRVFGEYQFQKMNMAIDCLPTNSISVKEVVQVVMDRLDFYKDIKFDPSKTWPEDQPYIKPANKNLCSDSGSFFSSSQTAIELAVDDILAGQSNGSI